MTLPIPPGVFPSPAAVLLAVLTLASGSANAADPTLGPMAERARVAASERYDKGRVHRFALGGGYRDLWKAEVEFEVLDLEHTGGGLEPTGRFGGLQTAVLGFKGGDGRSYTFRGTDKDPSAVLDPQLRETVLRTIVQDQMAAQDPGGPLAAGVISEAAGVLTIRERMVVMPDDERLGKYREEFAGMVGSFYEYPLPAKGTHPGFHRASDIIDHEELYARLRAGHDDPVLIEAFLRARLVDILLGDFDRHRKQWRWARLPGEPRWQPIPEDRDMAFVRYDGAGPRLAYLYVPILQNYGAGFPGMKGLTLHGWEQDRWLLAGLSWAQWQAVARDIQMRISDETIERAVSALPPEYAAIDGERLRRDLGGRRDQLERGARKFYEHLAREVDVQATDAAERVSIMHASDGTMLVELRHASDREGTGTPLYQRRFDPSETRDVRIYLRGGDDVINVTGASSPIRLRLIADSGNKTLGDSEGNARVYDQANSLQLTPDTRSKVDRRPYEPPPSDSGFVDVENVPPRDWGTDLIPIPQFGYEKDVGAFIGVGAIHTRYGFRKHPWSSRHHLSAGWATEAEQPSIRYAGQFRPENSKLVGQLEVAFSGIEILRFYGFGNETSDSGSDSRFRVRNRQLRVAPSVRMPLFEELFEERVHVSVGPWLEYSRTRSGMRLIDTLDPYGSGRFGSIGAFAKLQLDTRHSVSKLSPTLALPFFENPAAGYATGGFFFDVTAQFSPPVWDIDRTWGSVEASVSTFYSVGDNGRATLALRIGGKETFGRTPYYAAAYIGGGDTFSGDPTIRGYRAQRFVGDSSVFANADLRILVTRVKLVFPGDFGVFGFGDAGRVFVDGEKSDEWHPSGGGGLWFSALTRTNTISISVANSVEETLFYLRVGFHY